MYMSKLLWNAYLYTTYGVYHICVKARDTTVGARIPLNPQMSPITMDKTIFRIPVPSWINRPYLNIPMVCLYMPATFEVPDT